MITVNIEVTAEIPEREADIRRAPEATTERTMEKLNEAIHYAFGDITKIGLKLKKLRISVTGLD